MEVRNHLDHLGERRGHFLFSNGVCEGLFEWRFLAIQSILEQKFLCEYLIHGVHREDIFGQ